MSTQSATPLLEVQNLSVAFGQAPRAFQAVDGLSLQLQQGEALGLVGESGSGKSVSMLALMGLVDKPGVVSADALRFMGQDMLAMTAAQKRRIIGKDVAMIFQDAMSSLNPSFTVQYQLSEVLKLHLGLHGDALQKRCVELLDQVEIPDAASRLKAYPHELSGGMSQRVMIAMAIACEPKLLIADEPTTALDVTIQAQIIQLLMRLRRERDMALIMITHDLAVVSEVVNRVAVMYAGQLVESAGVHTLFDHPQHPYTEALLASLPERAVQRSDANHGRLFTLAGMVPGQYDRPSGCLLAPRCPYVQADCSATKPALIPSTTGDGLVRCLHSEKTGSATHMQQIKRGAA